MKPNRFKAGARGGQGAGRADALGVRQPGHGADDGRLRPRLRDHRHRARRLLRAREVADLIAWFSATTIAPFVRVTEIAYHLLARTMDAGALGVMVPNVKNAAEARAVVDAVKYAPLGKRGIGLGGALTGYRGVNPAEFLDYSNANTTVMCQIESVEGIENLEAIATTPGVDVLWVGHYDLSQSMGIPGQFHDERFRDNLKRVIAVCDRHNLGAGIQPGSIAQAQEWLETGFNVISYSTEMAVYLTAMTQAVQQVRALAAK